MSPRETGRRREVEEDTEAGIHGRVQGFGREASEGEIEHRYCGTPDRTRLMDAQMLAMIQVIYAELKGAYGSRRMVRELRDWGFPVNKGRSVERLMRENDIRARQ